MVFPPPDRTIEEIMREEVDIEDLREQGEDEAED